MDSKKIAILTAILAVALAASCIVPMDEADAASAVYDEEKGFLTVTADQSVMGGSVTAEITNETNTYTLNTYAFANPIDFPLGDTKFAPGTYSVVVTLMGNVICETTVTVPEQGGEVDPEPTPETYTITLVNEGSALVTITDAEGQAVNASTELAGEQTLTVAVAAPEGVEYESVTVNGTVAVAGENGYTAEVAVSAENATITVVVVEAEPVPTPETYKVTIIQPANGQIVVMNGETQVNDGDEVTVDTTLSVTVTADEGYQVVGEASYSLTVDDNVTIAATIVPVAQPGEDKIFSENETVQSGWVFNCNVTVNPGVTVTFKGDVTVNGNMYVYGNLIYDGDGSMEIVVADGKTFKAFSGAAIQQDVVIVAGGPDTVIDLADAMEIMDINKNVTSSNTYSQTQIVVITETLNLRTGTTTTILGQLQVNDGVVLTVESGATLVIDSETAKMIVDGIIEVEEGAKILVNDADDVTVSGEVVSNGEIYIDSTVTVKNGGSIVIEDADESSIVVLQGLTVENGGALTVMGQAAIADITNKGTVTLDRAVLAGPVTISQAADGAVVDIRSFTSAAAGYDLTVTDAGLVFKAATSSAEAVTVDKPNTLIVLGTIYGGVNNLTITQSVTSETVNKQTTYHNHMVLSGNVTIADESLDDADEVKAMYIEVSGPSIDVADALTLGSHVVMSVTAGDMNVTGTVTAVAEGSKLNTGSEHLGNVDVNVTGTVTVRDEIKWNINAFEYRTEVDGNTNYVYTTLAGAIDAAATTIYACGDVTVLDSVTIPAGTQVRPGNDAGTITIGDRDHRDVTVTVATDGQIRSCIIDVMGTLLFEDSRDNRNCVITSDVSVFTEPSAKYTNIYTALAGAQPGETVTISRDTVVLDRDITVGEGVTLEIPGTKTLQLNNGVTLTVDGTVRNSGKVTAETVFAPEASSIVDEEASAIAVNGAFMQMDEISYDYYQSAGAYYNLINAAGNWYYITPVAQAAAVSDDVTYGLIDIYGENTAADVTFTGDEAQPVYVTINKGAELVAGTVGLSYAQIDVEGTFEGAVSTAVGSIEVVNATGFIVADVYVDETETMTLEGTPYIGDINGAAPVMTVASGTVTVADTLDLCDLEDIKITDDKYVDGQFAVAAGAELVVSGSDAALYAYELSVDGALTAYDGGLVDAVVLIVNGTFTVSAADAENGISAGQANIWCLYVGIDDEFGAGSAATVSADKIIDLDTMFVSAGSTVSEKLTDGMRFSTEFYIEDGLWMTAYANSGGQVSLAAITPSELVNCWFDNWQYDDDGVFTNIDKDKDVIGTHAAVYALLDYDIYYINVYADPGVDAVYIDGVLMTGEVDGQMGWHIYVAAGTHEVSYKLVNGYSGTATMTVNGEKVSGLTFQTSGTSEEDTFVSIYLQGIDKSGYVPDSPDSGDDGMGLTDYLLIVLVILIVVIAVMIAIRMMRS